MSSDIQKNAKKAKKLIDFTQNPDSATFRELGEINENLGRLADKESPAFPAMPDKMKVELEGAEIVTIKGKDGKDGDQGIQGEKGDKGDQGDPGRDGTDGIDGEDGKDGNDGRDGTDGQNGKDGKNGVKGKDGSPDSPFDIKKKIESLEGDDRIDLSQFRGYEKFRDDVVNHSVTQARGILYAGLLENRGASSGGIANITGLISAGTNISLTGSGTSGDPYVINATKNGDVVGPASATDNAIARFDATTGKLIQNSGLTIDDGGKLKSDNANDGLYLQADVSGNTAQLRITGNSGAWIDNLDTAYFQAQYKTANNMIFMAGTSGADAVFERFMITSKFNQVTDQFFDNVPAPTAVFEVLGTLSDAKVVERIVGTASQSADLSQWSKSGGSVLSKITAAGEGVFPAIALGKSPSTFRRIDLLVGSGAYAQGIGAEAAASSDPIIGSYVTGDSFLRFDFQANGLMEWGGGTLAVDTNLYRNAANVLKTDDAFIVSLAFTGLSTGTFTGAVKSAANDGSALGASGTAWSDLFLASGAVIDFAASNYTLTHSSGVLTASGVITAGGNMNAVNFQTTGQGGFNGRDSNLTAVQMLILNGSNDAHFLANLATGNIADSGFGGFNSSVPFTMGGFCCGGALPTSWTFNASGDTAFQVNSVTKFTVSSSVITIADSTNLAFNTSTGTKIGSATSQKLSFWNATPIIQPTTGVAAATFVAGAGTAVNDASTFDGYTLKQIVKALRNIGLLA